ncbi:hypothetical protein P4U44_04835 [Alkalihalobacillus alcalophilus]|nr:transcriptional repressor [Bacillus phage BalMu-1]AJA42382.1 hypothetical protein BalMu1_B4 [Bacillus phage BalMu-1]AJA42438.1 hypothetical protein BalMu1_A4 [Bacillus phage BalMu-1]MED1561233.1 hypothetical protein [Alkalihalobacillus alcalophilus]
MAVRKQKVTTLGWEIKRKLAEMQVTHSEFCRQEGIPISRLSEIISGVRPNHRYRKIILERLDIKETA